MLNPINYCVMELEASILKILKKNPRGLTIAEVAEKLGIGRHCASRKLRYMAYEGLVEQKPVGGAIVNYAK